jgi:hypothetical protein
LRHSFPSHWNAQDFALHVSGQTTRSRQPQQQNMQSPINSIWNQNLHRRVLYLVTNPKPTRVQLALQKTTHEVRSLYRSLSIVINFGQVAYQGAAICSLLLNLMVLAIIGLNIETGGTKLAPQAMKTLAEMVGKSNVAITFLVITLLTLAGGFAARAQSSWHDERSRLSAQRAGEFFSLAGFDLFVSLGLIFSAQVITPESLQHAPGWFFDLLRFTSSINQRLGMSVGLLVLLDLARGMCNIWLSHWIPTAITLEAWINPTPKSPATLAMHFAPLITINLPNMNIANPKSESTPELQGKKARPKRHNTKRQ